MKSGTQSKAEILSAVLLFAALALAPVIGGGFGEPGAAVLQVLVLAAAVVYVSERRGRTLARAPGLIPLAIFAAAVIVSTVFTENIYSSLRYILLITSCIAGYLLAAALCRSLSYAAAAVWAVVISSLYVCLMGVRHYAIITGGGEKFWASLMGTGDHLRLFGPFINPGFFAGFLVMVLPVTLGAFLVTRRSVLVFVAGLAVVMETLALMLTGTKFGVIAAVGALLLFFLCAALTGALRRARFPRIIVLAVAMLPLLVVFSRPVLSRIDAAEAGGSQVHSTTFRIYTWKATASMLKANLLTGVGPGAYDVAYPRYAEAGPTRYAHQSYLQTAAESGVIAGAAFIVALIWIAVRALAATARGAKEAADSPREDVDEHTDSSSITLRDLVPFSARRVIACAVFSGLAGSGLRNLVDSDWYVIGIALPFWILAGVLVSLSGAVSRHVDLKPGLRVGVIAASVVFGLLTISFAAGALLAGNVQSAAEPAAAEARMWRLQMAVNVSPLNPAYRRELAKYLATPGLGDDPAGADAQLRTAIRLAPTDGANYYTRAMVAVRHGDPAAAADYLRSALKYSPNSTQALMALASVYERLGDQRGREQAFSRLLEIEDSPYEQVRGAPELVDTSYAFAHRYFGRKALAAHQYREALQHYDAAVERLERWRSHPEMLEVVRFTGQLREDEEEELLELLRECYYGVAEAFDGMAIPGGAAEARAKARDI